MPLPVFGSAGTYGVGTSTSVALVVPSGVAVDHVLFVHLSLESSGANTVTPPAGFTELTPTPSTTRSIHTLHVFWKRATAADSGTYTFTWSTSCYFEGLATRYTGCITTGTPIEEYTSASRSTAATVTPAVSLTSLSIDRLLVFGASNWASGSWTQPTGFTSRGTASVVYVATRDWPTASATGDVTATCSASNDENATLLALIPPDKVLPIIHPVARSRAASF